MTNRTADEITEIERHKYFLSERQGRDVGWDFAERDWEVNFGTQWREEKSRHNPPANGQSVVVADAIDVKTDDSPAEPIRHVDPAVCGTTRGPSPLKRLFSRLFAKTS